MSNQLFASRSADRELSASRLGPPRALSAQAWPSLTQSPCFRGPGIAWRREAPLALRGLREPSGRVPRTLRSRGLVRLEAWPTESSQRAVLPTESSQRAVLPTESSQRAVLPIEKFQQEGLPTESSQRAGLPTEISQRAVLPTESSQRAVLPTESSQRAGLPTEISQRAGLPTEKSQRAGVPTESSQQVGLPTERSQRAGLPTERSQRVGLPTESSQQADLPTESSQRAGLPTESSQQAGLSKLRNPRTYRNAPITLHKVEVGLLGACKGRVDDLQDGGAKHSFPDPAPIPAYQVHLQAQPKQELDRLISANQSQPSVKILGLLGIHVLLVYGLTRVLKMARQCISSSLPLAIEPFPILGVSLLKPDLALELVFGAALVANIELTLAIFTFVVPPPPAPLTLPHLITQNYSLLSRSVSFWTLDEIQWALFLAGIGMMDILPDLALPTTHKKFLQENKQI
ncbi:hypothetical protein PCASD_25553 [Puccinia coronata f. sp. avenae]|uniref:Uncharacterized protein n=1 Tax=Puccinia coronata f. sp. avenae TaxID=200324 RepID=A0A2N5THT8_9BASI|nr:hypothetical protein PCASD_25553 [Puccinia coronata f. sp. avenae]